MDTMNLIVAKNVKRLREEHKLSMEELAELSGVNKSMLTQIERGERNSTLSILWKTSNGMKIPFDALAVHPKGPYKIVRKSEIQPLLGDDEKVKNYPPFPDDENRGSAVYYLKLDVGSYWESEPHLRGTTEFIAVTASRIEICADGQRFGVGKDGSIRSKADVVHSYKNIGEEAAILYMTLFCPWSGSCCKI